MFTTKAKRSYRTAIMSVVIVLLCILIFIVAWPEKPVEQTPEADSQSGQSNVQPPQSSQTGQLEGPADPVLSGNVESVDPENDDMTGKDEDFAEKENMNQEDSSYYLVKRAGSQIVVYFCGSDGSLVQLETTDILYDMMGPEDQMQFDAGIRVDSQEQLSVLLQDFES